VTNCTLKKILSKNRFLSKNFLNCNLSQGCLHFWNQHKNNDLLMPILTYFKKKKCLTLLDSEKFVQQESNLYQKLIKIRENVFCKQVLDFGLLFKSIWSIMKIFNKAKITGAYCVSPFPTLCLFCFQLHDLTNRNFLCPKINFF
jgi:hypothetical protein